MKHAYLIMAHTEIDILKLLLQKLDDINNDIYLHLDKKFRVSTHEFSKCLKKSKLHFIKRMNVLWGGYSQIKCEIKLLETAVENGYDYYHLLTGVDLPIKTNEEINLFFEQRKGQEFISFDKNANDTRNFTTRYSKYHFKKRALGKTFLSKMFYKGYNIIAGCLEKIFNIVIKDRSKKANGLIFMKGSSYFDITHELADYILSKKSDIRRIFRFTRCCDEVFLHTLAYNSCFKDNLTFTGTRYIDWSKHLASPEILTIRHVDEIMSSKHLFARKFSNEQSAELINKIYNC